MSLRGCAVESAKWTSSTRRASSCSSKTLMHPMALKIMSCEVARALPFFTYDFSRARAIALARSQLC
eukprot:scaffold321996_cov33-Tisochrysis_lutea.AAC.6